MPDHPAYRHDAEKVGYENVRRTITEAEAEKYADARVLRALRTDSRYVHAENTEAQAEAEDAISREVWEALEAKYEIRDV